MENLKKKTHSNKFKELLAWRTDYYYDAEAAGRAVRFFENRLVHGTGAHYGKPFILEWWQRKIVRRLFGWKQRINHTRKFRTLFLFIPRKNGKTAFGAGLALYLLHADNEMGAEIVSCAASSEQANYMFVIAKDMNDADDILSGRGKSFRRSLVVHQTGSRYEVISADGNTKHGANLHGILFDELHTQKDRELYDVLKTSTSARRQPLEIYITTAGYDTDSICYEVYDYACKIRDGIITDDPYFMPVIFEASRDDDWTSEETWKKCNPNFGVSKNPEYMMRECKKAMNTPAFENTFKRLDLNIWTEQETKAVNMERWKACGNIPVKLEDLAGKPCWLGLDLSSVKDMTALAMIFRVNDLWVPILRYYLPENTYKEHIQNMREPFDAWVRDGFITLTKGGKVDYSLIRGDINAAFNVYDVREIAIDPWNSHQLSTELEEEDGFTVVQVRQGYYTLNAPTKEFLSSIDEVKWAHGNNPVFTWNANCLQTEEDPAGNLKPSKRNMGKSKRNDGVVAAITALSRAIVAFDENSVYSERGVLVL